MKWNKQMKKQKNRKKNRQSKQNKKLQKLKNTWNDKYKCNVIGKKSEIDIFITECNMNSIYYSKPQALVNGYQIVLFNKKAQKKVTTIAKNYKVIVNADIVTARRVL